MHACAFGQVEQPCPRGQDAICFIVRMNGFTSENLTGTNPDDRLQHTCHLQRACHLQLLSAFKASCKPGHARLSPQPSDY